MTRGPTNGGPVSKYNTLFFTLSFLTLTFTVNAHARLDLLRPRPLHRLSVEPHAGAGMTYFDQVIDAYRAGEGVPLRSIRGVYAGRCYYADHPMKPVAALAVAAIDGEKAAGPLGTAPRLIPLADRESAPERYDKMDARQYRSVVDLALSFSSELALPVEVRRETFVVGLRTPEEDTRLYRFRRDEKALYVRLECAEDSVCLSANPGLGRQTVMAYEGQAIAQCHFFKRFKFR